MASDPNTILKQAVLCHQLGRLTEAEKQYRTLLNFFPKHPGILSALGAISLQQGKIVEGVAILEKSLKIDPNQFQALCNRGLGLAQLQRMNEAIKCLDRAAKLNPNEAELYNNRGNVLEELNRLDEALSSYSRAIALKPDYAEAYNNQGTVLEKLNRLDEALISYSHAISLNPDYAEAYNNRGNVLKKLNRLDEAISGYEFALALKPDYAKAAYNRGLALQQLRQLDEALSSYNHAIALKPDYAEAYNNRGAVLDELNQLEEALRSYEQAIVLNPSDPTALCNRGDVLQHLHRLDESLESYERAIKLAPDYAEAYWNKALLKLLNGDFEDGWRLYEWRWKGTRQKEVIRNFKQPLWLGEQSVKDKTLLIHAEQGLGDVIQFCRYVPIVKRLGANILLEAPHSLIPLLRTLECDLTIIEDANNLPDFDLHCPIMSLPLALKTTIESIPASVPYLYANSEKKNLWKKRLGKANKSRIGLVFSGSTTHKNDCNRSIPVQLITPLLQLDFEFHALHKEIRKEDINLLSNFSQLRLHLNELEDFSDTAALVNEMDLVISVDTSVAHLAGALGKEVWILIPYIQDFRWLLNRSDSPWYPTATLFRQPKIADWSSVISEVESRLKGLSR